MTVDGLQIQNKGDVTGESTTNRAAIYVYAENVVITNNTITNGLGSNEGLSNAIQIMSSKESNPLSSYAITGNTITGHSQSVTTWSSSGIVIAQGFNPGSIGGERAESITATAADYEALLTNNTLNNNKIDLTHQDWSNDGDEVVIYPLIVKHEVSFNSDGGSVVESQTINEGSKANRPVNPTKEGYNFLGWYLEDLEFDFDTLITEAITLTAHWEEAEPEEPGDEVEATTEYIFTSNSWGTSQDDWTSGKGGNQYQSGRGIQVTSGASGANGTTNITFYNVKSIEITYSTNKSDGAGTIVTKVGNETVQTFTVSTSGGTTNRSAGVINVDSLDGAITITINCTTNSIYLYGIKIVHTES